MPDPVTNNYGLTLPTVGADIGVWGGIVNTNVFTFIDAFLGNVLSVAMTNVDVTLTLSQWQNNGVFKITGALAANVNLILPLSPNSVGSATAVAGKFVVDNQATGNFTVTVKTAATSSVGFLARQGGRTAMYSDGVNVLPQDDTRIAKFVVNAGDPSGAVSGNAGNAASGQPADAIWDTTNQQLSISIGGTAWVKIGQAIPLPGGYLTPSSGVPIILSDVTGATAIVYSPYTGNQCPVYNGAGFSILPFSELTLTLAAGAQLASNIYDVFAFINAGVLQVGFGPSWLSGGTPGSITPGSCVRGIGAASTALSRLNGILVNTNNITLNNGASTFTPLALQATYLGSIFVDVTNGQVSCYRSWGQSRKFGIWNAYNRATIVMQGGDSTGSWTYNVNTWRQSRATAANTIASFTGLAEEQVQVQFNQNVSAQRTAQIGIGLNSTTSPSGFAPIIGYNDSTSILIPAVAAFTAPPSLGINNINMLEAANAATDTYFGSNLNMLFRVAYRG